MSAPASRVSLNRRTLLRASAGTAGILATGRAPAFAQAQPKKLVFAHINAIPKSAAVAFDWMAKEVTAQSERCAGDAVLRQDPDPARAGDHERGQVRKRRDGQPGRRRRNRVSGNGRAAGTLSGEGLCLGLRDAQWGDRRQDQQADRGQLQTQGDVLLRLRLPPFLDIEEADHRAERPARGEDPRCSRPRYSATPSTGSAAAPYRWRLARSSPPPSKA